MEDPESYFYEGLLVEINQKRGDFDTTCTESMPLPILA